MKSIIVDDTVSYIESLTDQEWSADPVRFTPAGSQEIGDLSPRGIAKRVAGEVGDDDAVVFINVNLKSESKSRQDQAGVEVLKFLRLTERFDERKNEAQDTHCVMYSFQSVEQLLRERPPSLIVCSDGVTFKRLPCDLSELDLRGLAEEKAPVDDLDEFLRGEFRLPDERHSWANWWAARQMMKLYFLEKMQNLPIQEEDHDETPAPGSIDPELDIDEASSTFSITEIREKVVDPQLRNALYLFDRPAALEDEFSPVKREQLLEYRDILRDSDLKIGLIDDEAHKISRGGGTSIGWQKVYSNILYENDQQVVDLLDDNHMDVRLDASNEGTLKKLLNRIECDLNFDPLACVFLDLRLLEDSTKPGDVDNASGIKVLKKIREVEPSVPVIVTTASNKVSSFFEITKTGADAYWVKQGVDERRVAEESVSNYIRLLNLASKTKSKEYQFFRRFGKEISSLKKEDNLWWENHEWYDDKYENKVTTRGRREIVFNILEESVLMTRSYLKKSVMEYTNQNTESSGSMINRVTLWSIFQHLGKVLEEIHRWDKMGILKDKNNGTIGGHYTNSGEFQNRRKDWFGYRLYSIRNNASHLETAREEIGVKLFVKFASDLLCYLEYEPRMCEPKQDKSDIPSIKYLRNSNDDYRKKFRNIITY